MKKLSLVETYLNADFSALIFRLNPLCPKHLVSPQKEETRGSWFLCRWLISLSPLCKGMAKHSIKFFFCFLQYSNSCRKSNDYSNLATHGKNKKQ